ncbi:MAG TPA: 50S ribosomal protein L4 [Acidimicrobiales bacterium]|nr:50S ribosomal protein L4 [Acidimicrobiales bacterium]
MALDLQVRRQDGTVASQLTLDAAVFGTEPNVAVMHQVVTAQLAAARAGTQSTLTRAEVRGGGAKPWRQKGTGRARQGSTRAPHWAGGGVALGPKPRDYRQRTPKKMVALALRSALSDRAAEGRVAVVDSWSFDKPSTKGAKAALAALEIEGRVLVVLAADDEAAALSFRNLPWVHIILDTELNAYDVLRHDWVVFTRASLPTATSKAVRGASARVSDAAEPAATAPAAAAAAVAGAPEAAGGAGPSTAGPEPAGGTGPAAEAEAAAPSAEAEAVAPPADDAAGEGEA